jgi:pyruvate dehydrogenase E2 component (dihydrolipoamide acetyltransferase)
MQGGTFTITNAGALGGGFFAPIINYPEVAILGMGRASLQPKAVIGEDGEPSILPRRMMPLVLCIDHRVLDGADAIRFLEYVRTMLEDPEEMLLRLG